MTKFLILTNARSGSNMLVSALKHHPNAVCYSELINREILWGYSELDAWGIRPDMASLLVDPSLIWLRNNVPGDFLDVVYNHRYKADTHAVGFKLFFSQGENIDNPAELWSALAADRSIKILWLRRRDFISQYYSFKKAEQTGEWIYNSNNFVDTKQKLVMRIHIPSFMHHMGAMQALEQEYLRFFTRHERLDLVYEDITENFDREVTKILDFLQLPQIKLYPATFRQNVHAIRDLVENYDEVEKVANIFAEPDMSAPTSAML